MGVIRVAGVNDSAGDAVLGQKRRVSMLHFIAFGLSLLGLARSFFSGVQNAPVSVFSEKTPLAPVISQPVNARIRNPKVHAEA